MDVSGSNKRLYYRALSVGTLRLADADPAALARLMRGAPVRLEQLVPSDGSLEGVAAAGAARKAAETLAGKAQLGQEETGDNPVRLAVGLATWAPVDGAVTDGVSSRRERAPLAPLLLAPVAFTRVPGGRAVASLQLVGEPELNSALRYVLRAHFGVDLDAEGLLAEAVSPDGSLDPDRLLKAATRVARRVRGWDVQPHVTVDAFGSDRDLMLRDLEDVEVLAQHPLLAAMAGDTQAVAHVRGAALPEDDSDLRALDAVPPASEHLVLDADSSQQAVIGYALAGRSLVVQGPPGTGKSQTIANLLAEAAASGKTVLFVAQKRAAVDAVLSRLEKVGLDDWVLEVFDSTTRRGAVVRQIGEALETLASATYPDTAALHRDLIAARDTLRTHGQALHSARLELDGGSVFELLGDIAGVALEHQTDLRVPSGVAAGWYERGLDALGAAVDELHSLGGLDPARRAGPGWNPDAITTPETATRGYDTAASLAAALPTARLAVTAALADAGLAPATTLPQAQAALGLLSDTAAVTAALSDGVLDPTSMADDELDRLVAALGDKAERGALPDKLGWLEKRRLRKQARSLRAPGEGADDRALHDLLALAREVRTRWASSSRLPGAGEVAMPSSLLASALVAMHQVDEATAALVPLTQHLDCASLSFEEAAAAASTLLADPGLPQLPRAHHLQSALMDAGAGAVLGELALRIAAGGVVDLGFPSGRLRWVAHNTALEYLRAIDPALSRAGSLAEAAETYQAADRTHININRQRAERAAAARAHQVLSDHPEQRAVLLELVKKKRSFKSLRQIVEEAPEALLALKPCWAMSPLLVSRYLPAIPGLFDLVVFDEASQILIPDAVPSLLRGRQAIVAGDDKQLPPTTVFTKMLDGTTGSADTGDLPEGDPIDSEAGLVDEDMELAPLDPAASAEVSPPTAPAPSVSVASGYASILTAMSVLLPQRTLLWHYRSRDERLIAVSNREVYRDRLITFPGTTGAEVISHVAVPPSAGLGKTNKSPIGEVERVRDLVLSHARAQLQRPEDRRESLGVIAMGREHADRVEKAVFDALEQAPDRDEVAALFEAEDDAYFIKNIERVQGDERDAIILTVGYTTGAADRPIYMWGPLLLEHGVNRLNVAISRARARMTLVTSFTADQLPAGGSKSAGYALLREFVSFAASGGTRLTRDAQIPMNPFENEIYERLTTAGLHLDPQYGVSRYRLDFAVRHPDYDGTDGPIRHLLAIEADGRAWHSGFTARERDRLRQQHLEILGWRFCRIWSTDWFRDPDTEIQRVLDTAADALDRDRRGERPAPLLPEADPRWTGARRTPATGPPEPRRPPSWVTPGTPIDSYTDQQLVALVQWLRTDNVLRLPEDELTMLVSELGYQRKGPKIVARLSAAQSTPR